MAVDKTAAARATTRRAAAAAAARLQLGHTVILRGSNISRLMKRGGHQAAVGQRILVPLQGAVLRLKGCVKLACRFWIWLDCNNITRFSIDLIHAPFFRTCKILTIQFTGRLGGNSIDKKSRPKTRPKTRPKPNFEKNTCMNFKIGEFFIILLHGEFGFLSLLNWGPGHRQSAILSAGKIHTLCGAVHSEGILARRCLFLRSCALSDF